ncbi:hypothetical protein Tco_0428119 [Tanacetum coccineum]
MKQEGLNRQIGKLQDSHRALDLGSTRLMKVLLRIFESTAHYAQSTARCESTAVMFEEVPFWYRLQKREEDSLICQAYYVMLVALFFQRDLSQGSMFHQGRIPREEFAEDVESLSTKYPIMDWKTYTLTENFMYYQIFRGDGSSKNYKVLSEMLEDFDRQDVEELYRLVKERYSASRPEGYDLMLWGDLHTLFEPDEEDEIWKNQHEYNVISWSLYDFCGIHILLMQNGIAIHMLTEKKYPLSQEMISKMLKKKLEVDHESSQAFELLRIDQGVGSTSGIRACALRNFDLGVMELENSQNNALAKLPMLKLGEYEMWEIRIKQYFQIQDYALWEVIENGNSWVPIPVTATETGPSTGLKMIVPSTAEENICKKNDVKARILLLMALPNEHQLTFD